MTSRTEQLLQALTWNAARPRVLDKLMRRPAGGDPVLCSRHATAHAAYVVATGLRRVWPDLEFSVRDVSTEPTLWGGEIYAKKRKTT